MLNPVLKIDPKFKAVCPPLTKEERRELRESIKRDGCREDILTWRGFVIDGHNRLELCEELHKPYTTRPIVELKSRGEVIQWILRNQLGRRNLTAMQRAELALKLKDAIAAEAKKRQVSQLKKGAEKPVVPTLAPRENGKTRDELAKMANVSHGTLAKVEKIIAGAEPEVVEAARKGEMSINKAYQTVAPTPAPKKPAPEPQDGFAIVADVDAPESEERDTEPPRAVPVEAAPEPVKRIKNWERFNSWNEAYSTILDEGLLPIRGQRAAPDVLVWMFMDYIPGERRIDYLRRLKQEGILNPKGCGELNRRERKRNSLPNA